MLNTTFKDLKFPTIKIDQVMAFPHTFLHALIINNSSTICDIKNMSFRNLITSLLCPYSILSP